MAEAALADRLRATIRRDGPLAVSSFVDAALYDRTGGFYATGGQAGRRGDFLTAPEVGPLFGAVISNAVDTWWDVAGRPETFTVVEHGAGPGTLARTVTLASGDCLSSGALRWVMVDASPPQRERHPEGAHLRSLGPDAPLPVADVVFANELLDNLPFDIAVRVDSGWQRLAVGLDGDNFALLAASTTSPPPGGDRVPVGSTIPIVAAATAWCAAQRLANPAARLVLLDYAADTAALADRDGGWLRAFQAHQRVDDWLHAPGTCDITIDLPLEQIRTVAPDSVRPQAAFLQAHGIDELVEEGRLAWHTGAGVGDLAAIRGRSRVSEAEALLDPGGMGAFTVFEWEPASD